MEDRATGTDADACINTLLQSLKDQVVYLRQEAEDWKEEARRKDTIIMSLAQCILELEAPVSDSEGADNGTAFSETQKPSERRKRSWWREFFGLL
jgi:hypothetical protein